MIPRRPAPTCRSTASPIVTLGFALDASGASAWQFRVPQSLFLDLRVQAADFGGAMAPASHGLYIACLQ